MYKSNCSRDSLKENLLNLYQNVSVRQLLVVLFIFHFFHVSFFKHCIFILLQRGFPHPTQSSGLSEMEREKIYTWVLELSSPDTREHALLELRY